MAINRLIVDARCTMRSSTASSSGSRLKVGNPADDDTVVGPLINQGQFERL